MGKIIQVNKSVLMHPVLQFAGSSEPKSIGDADNIKRPPAISGNIYRTARRVRAWGILSGLYGVVGAPVARIDDDGLLEGVSERL